MITFDPSAVNEYAITVAILGMGIVFASLLSLSLIFGRMPHILRFAATLLRRIRTEDTAKTLMPQTRATITGEENAAIALALHLYLGAQHDLENPILTIQKTARTYSPWSSKIYGILRNTPTR
ncbi:MAG: hypothetical protein OHK0039_13550 [Bacteroidia bacterium]